MNFEHQTTNVIECDPEDLSHNIIEMGTEYLKREHGRMQRLQESGAMRPTAIAHQILILP